MKPEIITLPPTYQKDTGLWLLELKPEAINLPTHAIHFTESSLVSIPSRQYGGNHLHPRIELFAALTEGMELVWLDESGKQRTLLMRTHHQQGITFYFIPPKLPHAVNNSSNIAGYLLEFASEKQRDVESVQLLA